MNKSNDSGFGFQNSPTFRSRPNGLTFEESLTFCKFIGGINLKNARLEIHLLGKPDALANSLLNVNYNNLNLLIVGQK